MTGWFKKRNKQKKTRTKKKDMFFFYNHQLFTLGWTHAGTGHYWRKPPGFAQCLGGWHTSYGDAPVCRVFHLSMLPFHPIFDTITLSVECGNKIHTRLHV